MVTDPLIGTGRIQLVNVDGEVVADLSAGDVMAIREITHRLSIPDGPIGDFAWYHQGSPFPPVVSRDADERAEALLLEYLDEDQRASYEASGTFMVEAASGRIYTLGREDMAAICPEDNRWWCLLPVPNVPQADWILACKLWLEADEAGFLAQANEFVLRREGWTYLSPMAQNCRCDIEFGDTGPLHLETLEEARAWAERQNWDVELTIEHNNDPIWCDFVGRGRLFTPEPIYWIDGRPSDAHTVDLLRQVAIERTERHVAAFGVGVEMGRERWGIEPPVEFTEEQIAILSSLDCPMEVHVREGHCDDQP